MQMSKTDSVIGEKRKLCAVANKGRSVQHSNLRNLHSFLRRLVLYRLIFEIFHSLNGNAKNVSFLVIC
jgi:hypothetical protein